MSIILSISSSHKFLYKLRDGQRYSQRSRVLPVGLNPYQTVHSAICLTTGPQPLPRRVLHTVRPSASSCNLKYSFFSLRSSISCLRLLPLLPVTSILSSIFPSLTCFKSMFYARCDQYSPPSTFLSYAQYSFPLDCKQFFFISHTIDPNNLNHPASAPHLKPSPVFPIYFPKCPSYNTIKHYDPNVARY